MAEHLVSATVTSSTALPFDTKRGFSEFRSTLQYRQLVSTSSSGEPATTATAAGTVTTTGGTLPATCSLPSGCSGTVQLFASSAGTARAKAVQSPTVLAIGSVHLRHHQLAKIKFTLTSSGRRLLGRKHRVKLIAVFHLRGPHNLPVIDTSRITLLRR